VKLLSSTDYLHLCCQANANFAQTLKQTSRGSTGESGYVKINEAYHFSNLKTVLVSAGLEVIFLSVAAVFWI